MKKKTTEGESNFSTDVPATQLKRELSSRGISAWEGYKCCVRGRNLATRFISEVADKVEELFHFVTRGADPRNWLAPSLVFPVRGPEVAAIPKQYVGRPGVPGPAGPAIAILEIQSLLEPLGKAWSTDSEMPIPSDSAQAELMMQSLRATATSLRRKTESDCYRCIRRKLWGQKKLRRTVTILSSTNLKSKQSTRSIGDRKLNLRTPHR